MTKKDFALRKRQQITKAQQVMFVAVAVSSILLGFGLVSSVFLIKKTLFNNKIITEQDKTISNLQKNLANIEQVKNQVKLLFDNELLKKHRLYDKQDNLQVILDALPDKANSVALGSSLRTKILNSPTIQLDNLSVIKTEDEIGEDFSGQVSKTYQEEYSDIKAPAIYFRFKLSGNVDAIYRVLRNVEHSIRPMFVDKIEIQGGGRSVDERGRTIPESERRQELVVSGRTFYLDKVVLKMSSKVIKGQ